MTTLSERQKAYLVELIRRAEKRLYFALAHHRTTNGSNLTFNGREYLLPIYQDHSKKIIIKKSVQCGISEWLIIEALSKCDDGLSVFYVLPKYELRNTFVGNRVDKLFNMVPFYRSLQREAIGESDSKQIKHFSKGTVKFASSNTESDFAEFPADMVIIDEMDRCDQGNLGLAEDRIKASKHKLVRKVANPTITGYGISDEFKASDQKEWMVKCDGCGEYQELDFFKVVVEETEDDVWVLKDKDWSAGCGRDIECVCGKCGAYFNRFNPDAYWARKNPESDVSGYHISRMMDPSTAVRELWDIWRNAQGNETKKQIFSNSDLGIEYESKGSKLTSYVLDKCVRPYPRKRSSEGTVMGVDIGAVLHVTISEVVEGNKRKKIFIDTVPGFDDIDQLIRLYNVSYGVVDALPETHEAKKLRDRYPGKIFLCEFHTRQGNTKDMATNEKEFKITVDRTQIFDETHEDIIKENVYFPQDAKFIDNGQFYEQMCAPTRILDPEKGRFVWREGSKQDHYRLADVYEKIALKVHEERSIFFISQGDDMDIMPGN